MRMHVNRDECCGNGECVLVAPDLFAQDEEGIVVVLFDVVPPDQEAAARSAVVSCPAGVIRVE